jgi:hypothetical protein
MLSIVIGDSPEHLVNLTNIKNLLTTLSHSMESTSIFDIDTNIILKKSDVESLTDWISSMINVLTSSYDELPEIEISHA